jgi:hypothetical protein
MKRFAPAAAFTLLASAHAGHEFPFYPSFYPQEITIEALEAEAAAERLAKGSLHAYAGALKTEPPKTAAVTSLGGYVLAVAEPGACVAADRLRHALPAGAVWHPYPVTPFHGDYLHHADRAEAARSAAAAPGRAAARVQIVTSEALLARASARQGAWSGPPWLRQGWFHAYLLLAPVQRDARIEDAARRLMGGEHRSPEERVELERGLVARLQAGCGRAVIGYTLRREHYAVEYSAGVENVGYDALEGMAAPIFPRTVKLRDFPWNGWLALAAPAPPSSAWNPLRGFGDAFGRLVWSALADPAFLPAPHGGGWIDNRVSAAVEKRGKGPGTRIVYRVRASAFHDGTPMSFADIVHAHGVAGAERPQEVRLLRVETETLAFGEDKLTYQVPLVEVRVEGAGTADAAIAAPPWSTLPWHLIALMEEGERRGYFKLTEVDPVRDAAAVKRLGELAREFEERAHVPPALAAHVKASEARERYRRLREFHSARGHWLVTNGPYRLERWDGAKAVLGVFRDPSYPKGLGSFNAYAVPLKAHVTRVERRGAGALVHTETEWLERLGRDTRVVRGSFAQRLAERLAGTAAPSPPVCHYLLLGEQDRVVAAGEVGAGKDGACHLKPGTGGKRLLVAAVLEGGMANVPIRTVPWE